MKHLFVINSHTTCMSALGTIEYLHLNDEDIVFVLVRNYKNILIQGKFKEVDLSWAYSYQYFNSPFSCHRAIKKIDKQIKEGVGNNKYVMYAANPGGVRILQIIFTNSLCSGFNYLQEGALVLNGLLKERPLPISRKVLDVFYRIFLGHRLWASYFSWRVPYFVKDERSNPVCYALNDSIFKELGYKQKSISWPKFKIENKYAIDPQYPCFIFESSVEMNIIEKEIYMHFVEELIEKAAGTMNYFKFHPYQSAENKEYIIGLFSKRGLQYKELSMEFPFEVYLSSYDKLTILGFKSSLLVFAKELGHNTLSLENELLANSSKYRHWRQNVE